MKNVAVCIGCGCTDNNACVDEYRDVCSWRKVDRVKGVGVCSFCPKELVNKLDNTTSPVDELTGLREALKEDMLQIEKERVKTGTKPGVRLQFDKNKLH
ncbi:hypothetical protein I2494_17990 [Budviciaceae bacterium BWR-B9]|uniref:Uncharacterized protein n=1 Tax=Limnobaculum allomyrinae TaxID=2791986 RepID=A0ABS1IV04_9GAMM|nr:MULTISPECIES: hypothetical protein [Limnobaculum]MBK5145573.1 hypothetical protein [Limnobaculum allomyrinae]MBV7693691.1 hypothetical protein [Limnobaculum sp. M2-1]